MNKLKFFLFLLLCLSTILFGTGIDQADTYHKNSDLQWIWAMSTIEKYPWIGNERILDIGCGDGKITMKLCEIIPYGVVVGLDISPKMLSFANNNFKVSDHHNLLFMLGDAQQLPFTSQFDLVVSFCTLHWVLDQQRALEQIKEALFYEGKALLVLPATCPNNLSTQCERLVCTQKWAPYFPGFKPQRIYFEKDEYESLIRAAGLLPISIDTIPTETFYPHKEALINWLKPLVTFIDHLSKQLQNEFLDDLADQMLIVDPAATDGSIRIHHCKLEILAIKR